jgi:cytidylate kinase
MNENRKISIAIDGPAGAGKSTIAKLVALRFGLEYVDTGAMYRGVALKSLRAGVAVDDADGLSKLAVETHFSFRVERPSPDELINRVFIDGHEITDDIRTPEVSAAASKVSAVSGVRRALVSEQKKLGARGGVVMEGRDICNVVLPEAEVKIFLTASAEERARRRHLELAEKGLDEPYEKVLADIRERDERDSARADSPLGAAPDASIVDTDGKGIEQVVAEIAAIAEAK